MLHPQETVACEEQHPLGKLFGAGFVLRKNGVIPSCDKAEVIGGPCIELFQCYIDQKSRLPHDIAITKKDLFVILLKDIRGSFFGINHRKASANLSDLLVNILQLHVICPAELKNFFGRDVAGQGSVRSGYGMFCNAP